MRHVLPRLGAFVLACSTSGACGGATAPTSGPGKVEIPVAVGGAAEGGRAGAGREPVPPPGAARDQPFPRTTRSVLANGLRVVVVPSRALPLVQVRLVVRAGSADAPRPAVAALAGTMLVDGGTRAFSSSELLRRIETLGADLAVRTSPDATVLSMPLVKAELSEGLALLAQVAREPRFDDADLRKARARAVDEATGRARGDGPWAAEQVVWSEIYGGGGGTSTYATHAPSPTDLARVDGAALRDFHRRFFVPKGATLVLAGDLDEAEGNALAEKHFGAWSGDAPPVAARAPARAPKPRVIVVHRPGAAQSDVLLATVAPGRKADTYPALRVASEVLGGTTGRLFQDVRDRRGLASTTWARPLEVAVGDTPFVAYAGTETSKTVAAVQALLDDVAGFTGTPPTAGEVAAARTFASDSLAVRTGSIGDVADLVALQDEMSLPDGYWDAYRRQLRAVEPSQVVAAGKTLFPLPSSAKLPGLLVVAGDAEVVAAELTRFGDVTVVDPEKEFRPMRSLPQASK